MKTLPPPTDPPFYMPDVAKLEAAGWKKTDLLGLHFTHESGRAQLALRPALSQIDFFRKTTEHGGWQPAGYMRRLTSEKVFDKFMRTSPQPTDA